MTIDRLMDLATLRDMMGQITTDEEAVAMRDELVERYEGRDTSDLTEREWMGAMRAAMTNV